MSYDQCHVCKKLAIRRDRRGRFVCVDHDHETREDINLGMLSATLAAVSSPVLIADAIKRACRPDRNKPCPCGSGKLFFACCMKRAR